MRLLRGIVIVLLALVAAACSSSGDPDDTGTTTTVGSTDVTTTSVVQTTVTTTIATLDDPIVSDADPIELLTPVNGGGIRPLLKWTPVPSAASYTVIVYNATGAPYWSAITTESQVYVGGPLQIPVERTGPNIGDGYSWAVYADDAAGEFLAASPLRDISP